MSLTSARIAVRPKIKPFSSSIRRKDLRRLSWERESRLGRLAGDKVGGGGVVEYVGGSSREVGGGGSDAVNGEGYTGGTRS